MKLSVFGDCKAVLLFSKVNKGAIAVVTLDVLPFTTLLKPEMPVAVVVLTGNNVVPGDGKLVTAT